MTIRITPLGLIATLTTCVLIGLVVYAKMSYVPRPGSERATQMSGAAALTTDVEVTEVPPLAKAAIVLDLYDTSALAHVATSNAWLRDTIASPLGQGFWGAWLGVFGTRGADFGGHFSGTLFEAGVKAIEGELTRIVWFTQGSASSAPALLIEKPSSSAKALFGGVAAAAARQTFHITSCPLPVVDPADEEAAKTPKKEPTAADKVDVVRWSLAGKSLYVTERNERIAVSSNADASLNAACGELPVRSSTPKSAMALQLLTQNMHRETQVLPKLLGLGEVIRFDVAVKGDTLEPLGIAGNVENARLANAAIDPKLLAVFAEDTPFVFAANVALPAKLASEALSAFYADSKGAVTRQVVVGWNPRGAGESDVLVAWSKADDAASLKALFTGAVWVDTACSTVVIASNKPALETARRVCNGKQPSLAHLAKPVVDHLGRDAAVNVSLQPGKLLSHLMLDAYKTSTKEPALPPEIDDAQKRLEQLPFIGFAGALSGQTLVGAGYRS